MVTTKAMAKVAAVATGLAMATSMLSLAPMAHAAALTSSQVQSILSLLSSFGADSTTIANVQASLTGSAPVSTGTGSSSSSCSFTKDLTVGSTGAAVTCLQNGLKANGYMTGNATGYFGSLTKAAVMKWQAAAGITPAAGYFGAKSRAAFGGASTGTTGGTTGGVSAGTGTGLKIAVSATSPSGSVLVQGQGIGDLADFTFSNPTSAPIAVTGLTFKRVGVSNDSAMTNVYLYNGATRISDSAGISASQFSYSAPAGIFTVPAGGVYTVSVRSDIAASTSGQQIGVSLVAASTNGTLDSSVSFPIVSGYQTVSAATLASVVFNTTTLPTANTSLSPANDIVVWQNSVAVSTNPVKLNSIRFMNLGSVDSTYVINLRLYVDGAQVGSAVPAMAADRSVTFDLSAAPVSLTTQTHIIKVVANVTGGSSRTLQLSVQRSSDAMFVDSQLGQPVVLNTTSISTNFSAANAGLQTIAAVTANSGVSVSLDPTSPTANIATGATSVKFATFAMLASGENVKVQDLFVVASSSVSGVISGVGGLNNGKVFVNGVQVGSTKDINAGTSATASGSATDFALGSSLILPAGVTTKVDIYADAQDTAGTNLTSGASVVVSLIGSSVLSNGQGQSSLVSTNVPNATVSTNAVTVTSSSLAATKYTGYGNQTIVAGSNNAKLGAFTLSTGSTEGVNVNTIVITMSAANAASITNLTLKDDATGAALGTIVTTPSQTNTYSVSYAVPASSTKTIDIYGNVLAGANAGSIVLSVNSATAGTGMVTSISTSPTTAALQTIVVGNGSLSVATGAGDPTSTNVIAGASSVKVGQFNFAAANSSYTVNNLAILVPNGSATSVTNVTVSYKDVNGATQTATQSLTTSATAPFATATFTGLGMYVPMNDSAAIDVSVGTPTIASGATSGAAIQVSLDAGNTTGVFSATDSAGNATIKINNGVNVTSAGTFYVRKSIPTFAMLSTGTTVPTTGSPVYKFSITADPAGAVEWTHLTFNIATSGGTTNITGLYLTDDASGVKLDDQNATTTTGTTATFDLGGNTISAKYAQVAAGATKTYNLYGTVSGFTTGSTITISLASDTTVLANQAAAPYSNTPNTVWSDRSATSHTTATTDWTNGYLLKNFTSNAVSYSK